MNNYISFETIDLAKKLKGYNMLFNYRMSNLCVKAEPTALMPVTVFVAGTEYNLEDVANILRPDDFSFDVYPKNQNNLQDIITGILDAHPEFKMELKTDKAEMEGGADTQHVFYTMPPVDKDRRKLLNETTKTFHKTCRLGSWNPIPRCHLRMSTRQGKASRKSMIKRGKSVIRCCSRN